jgi:hypothetical protein
VQWAYYLYSGERAWTKVKKGKEQHGMQGKELRTDQVLRSDASSGQRVREQKAGVAGKSYSLERKVSSTYVACEYKKG